MSDFYLLWTMGDIGRIGGVEEMRSVLLMARCLYMLIYSTLLGLLVFRC